MVVFVVLVASEGSTGVELPGSTILILILVFIVAILYYSPPIIWLDYCYINDI